MIDIVCISPMGKCSFRSVDSFRIIEIDRRLLLYQLPTTNYHHDYQALPLQLLLTPTIECCVYALSVKHPVQFRFWLGAKSAALKLGLPTSQQEGRQLLNFHLQRL